MKFPPALLAIGAFLSAGGLAPASVTLLLSNPATGVLTNIADSTGNAASGLVWGIVVDADGDGFDLSTTFGPSSGLQLVNNKSGVALGGTDDVFFYDAAAGLTATSPGTEGGTGSITSFATMILNGTLGVNAGDLFAIVWFDRAVTAGSTTGPGTRWGIYTNPGLVLPPDSFNQPYGALFTGPDPIRPVPTPEPSASLLGLLGIVSLLRLRRR